MIVTFNDFDYVSDEALGGSLIYREVSDFLRKQKIEGVEFVPHSFQKIVSGKEKLPELKEDDVLICTAGAYAFYYYNLREKENKKFRIFHCEVTSFFSDNFLQEQLCSGLMRKGDMVLFLSEYQRRLMMKLFSHLDEKNTAVCLPLLSSKSPKRVKTEKRDKRDDSLIIGWAGKLSEEKNFDQALEVFMKVSRKLGNVKMLVCGPSKEEYMPAAVKKRLRGAGIDPGNYEHMGNGKVVPYEKMESFWGRIDVLLFPSVCGEPLGRVVIEAGQRRVPVIAGMQGAMPEILEDGNLVRVEYFEDDFNSYYIQPIGKVDTDGMVKLCCEYEKLKVSEKWVKYSEHGDKLIGIIKGCAPGGKTALNPKILRFIDGVELFFDASFNTGIDALMENAVSFLRKYSGKTDIDIIKTANALCDHLNYFPRFRIKEKKNVLFVSPHSDDSVLSCGGMILKHKRMGNDVFILTIFSGKPKKVSGYFKGLMKRMGMDDEDLYVKTRKDEDMRVSEKFELPFYWLDCPEGTCTCESDSDVFSGKGKVPAKLEEFVGNFDFDEIYLPMGIGNHTDHVSISEIAKMIGNGKVFFYEDFPYSLDEKALEERVSFLGEEMKLRPVSEDISAHIKDKIGMIGLYKSQVPLLFGTDKLMEERVKSYADLIGGGSGIFKERFWSVDRKQKPSHPVSEECRPELAVMEITRRCNLNCKMCYNYLARTRNEIPPDGLTTKDIKKFIDSCEKLGVRIVSLTGGEPFLRNDIFEIIRHVERRGMTSVVYTNGTLINKDVIRNILDSGLSKIFFSVDSSNPEVHDGIRGEKGAFEKTVRSIKLLNRMRKERKSRLEVRVASLVMGSNLNDIPGLVSFSKGLGVDGITFKPVRVQRAVCKGGRMENVLDCTVDVNSLWIMPNRLKELDRVIDGLIKERENSDFVWDKKEYLMLLKKYFRQPSNRNIGIACDAGKKFFVVDVEGNIKPCWGVDWGIMGNLKTDDIFDAWQSDKYARVREKMGMCELPCYNLLIHKKSHLR